MMVRTQLPQPIRERRLIQRVPRVGNESPFFELIVFRQESAQSYLKSKVVDARQNMCLTFVAAPKKAAKKAAPKKKVVKKAAKKVAPKKKAPAKKAKKPAKKAAKKK